MSEALAPLQIFFIGIPHIATRSVPGEFEKSD
jgi:hypothetical protein